MYIFNRIARYLSIFILAGMISFSSLAQVEVKWEKELSSNILWQEVTALGNLIVSSGNQLAGVNTETGAIIWSKQELAGLNRVAYNEIPRSPFFAVDLGKSILVLDQFSGDLVFDSQKAGIGTIEDYFLLYNSDAILVSGESPGGEPIMVSVKMSDGSVTWSMNEEFGKIISVTELGNKELLIVTLFNNYKLNAENGQVIWNEVNSAESEQMKNMGALGDLMKTMAENMVEDMDIELRFYRPEGSDVFYLGSQRESQSGFTSSSGGSTVSYENVYNAYNISDGKLVWDKALEIKGKLGQVAFLDNGILVLPDDGNRTKINLFDYKTREGKWGKKGKGIPIKGGIYDYLDAGDGILLVSQTSSNNYLNYLKPSAGIITFEKPVKVDGHVVGIVPLSSGILYITTESMNILDPNSGTLKWSKSIQTTPHLTAQYDGKIYAFDYKSKTLKVVDEQTEKVSELSGFQVKFMGGESPRNLEVLEDGIFLHSDQNVAKFGFDGTVKFQEYYPAPKEPGWKRALLYAEAVRGAYIGATSYYVAGVMAAAEDDVRQEDELAGEVVNELGNAYGDLGDQASNYAVQAFQMANARYKATQNGRDFMFIMSKQPNGIELLKVSKSSGKIEGRISLGKDREPIYAVDDITGQVYYRSDENKMTSYQAN
jgi:outer membrane protein assembly factor BamB